VSLSEENTCQKRGKLSEDDETVYQFKFLVCSPFNNKFCLPLF